MKKVIFGAIALSLLIVSCKKETIQENLPSTEVTKPMLKDGEFQVKPTGYDDIADFYGNHHNEALEDILYVQEIEGLSELLGAYNDYYDETPFEYTGQGVPIYFDVDETNDWLEDKDAYLAKLADLKTDLGDLFSTGEAEAIEDVLDATIVFVNNGNYSAYRSTLLSLRSQCESAASSLSLDPDNACESYACSEYVCALAIIGVGLYSGEYWEDKESESVITIISDPDVPGGLAPWVAADLIGAAVGAIGGAGSAAVSGDTSWSSFGWSVAFGAVTGSGGGLFRWLGW